MFQSLSLLHRIANTVQKTISRVPQLSEADSIPTKLAEMIKTQVSLLGQPAVRQICDIYFNDHVLLGVLVFRRLLLFWLGSPSPQVILFFMVGGSHVVKWNPRSNASSGVSRSSKRDY